MRWLYHLCIIFGLHWLFIVISCRFVRKLISCYFTYLTSAVSSIYPAGPRNYLVMIVTIMVLVSALVAKWLRAQTELLSITSW